MTTLSVRMPVSENMAQMLIAAGVTLQTQDFAKANAMRIEKAESMGKSPFLVRDVADTGRQILKAEAETGKILSVRELVENLLSKSEVFLQKVEKQDKPARFFLVVREVEAGFGTPTILAGEAQTLVYKIAAETYKYVNVWINPDATMTVNPAFSLRGNLVIRQLKFTAKNEPFIG